MIFLDQISQQTLFNLIYALTGLAILLVLLALSNPYRLRQSSLGLRDRFLSDEQQNEIAQIMRAWSGRQRLTSFQLNLMTIAGLTAGLIIAYLLWQLLDWRFALLGLVSGVLLGYYPHIRFEGGFPKSILLQLESEAPFLAATMHRTRGVSGMSLQESFKEYMRIRPHTATAQLLTDVPNSARYTDAVLALGLPSRKVTNWLQIMQLLHTVSELGDPEDALRKARDRVRSREEQKLRLLIKRKAFAAPAVTALILLPSLLILLLGAIILEAIKGLGGSIL